MKTNYILILVALIIIATVFYFLTRTDIVNTCLSYSDCYSCGKPWNTKDCDCHKGPKPTGPSECFPCENADFTCVCSNYNCKGVAHSNSVCSVKTTKNNCEVIEGCIWTTLQGNEVCILEEV